MARHKVEAEALVFHCLEGRTSMAPYAWLPEYQAHPATLSKLSLRLVHSILRVVWNYTMWWFIRHHVGFTLPDTALGFLLWQAD